MRKFLAMPWNRQNTLFSRETVFFNVFGINILSQETGCIYLLVLYNNLHLSRFDLSVCLIFICYSFVKSVSLQQNNLLHP
jgi:hypothetical protein